MKGEIVLEYPFKTLIYFIVALIIIGLIVTFRSQIISYLNLCQYTPQICKEKGKCSTILTREKTIDENLLKKYCRLCWEKTGEIDYRKDCLCYIVNGTFYPIEFKYENCELECSEEVSSLQIFYSNLFKKIFIKC